jgi:hypothetical protein
MSHDELVQAQQKAMDEGDVEAYYAIEYRLAMEANCNFA